jgi:hypothetical protein
MRRPQRYRHLFTCVTLDLIDLVRQGRQIRVLGVVRIYVKDEMRRVCARSAFMTPWVKMDIGQPVYSKRTRYSGGRLEYFRTALIDILV